MRAIVTVCKRDNSCDGCATRLRRNEAKGVRMSAKSRQGLADSFRHPCIALRLALFVRTDLPINRSYTEGHLTWKRAGSAMMAVIMCTCLSLEITYFERCHANFLRLLNPLRTTTFVAWNSELPDSYSLVCVGSKCQKAYTQHQCGVARYHRNRSGRCSVRTCSSTTAFRSGSGGAGAAAARGTAGSA